MRSDIVSYYPYREKKKMFFSVILGAVFHAFFVFLTFVSIDLISRLLFLVMAVFWLAVAFFRWRSIHSVKDVCVSITEDELIFLDRGDPEPQYQSIADYPYVYMTRSYKGFFFLIFSGDALDLKQQKTAANKSAAKERLRVKSNIVIPIDHSEHSKAFMAKIKAKYPALVEKVD